MSRAAFQALRSLARLRGVQTSYEDVSGMRHSASPETLAAVLRAMGEPLESVRDAPRALSRFQREQAARLVEPVVVDWTGARSTARVRSSAAADSQGRAGPRARRLECTLTLETGEVHTWRQPAMAGPAQGKSGGGSNIALPANLPIGRHRLRVRAGRVEQSAVVLTAPPRVGSAHLRPGSPRELGGFLPLYALRTRRIDGRSSGAADLTDLAALADWCAQHGAPIIGTLPLLAGFLDGPPGPQEHSPYAPITRLLFSEFWLDPAAAESDLALSPAARALLNSDGYLSELELLNDEPLVDYARVMRAKRRVLELLAQGAFANPQRRREIEAFARRDEHASDYAAFRAAVEAQRKTWPGWPERMQRFSAEDNGGLRRGDYDRDVARYHLYCQVLLAEQMGRLAERLRERRGLLYLDLPIGVHGGGYDTWRFRGAFAHRMDVGAPPDPLAASGQNWGFPPLIPEGSRADGHGYFAACIRAHLRHARLLRIDHVMALHRLFWIPRGMPASEGVYVRYPADELYATLSIEAHRAVEATGAGEKGPGAEGGVRIVGENLGTVPEAVNKALTRRGILRMHIAQFEFSPRSRTSPVIEPEAETLAALNTHDLPTFAAFYHGRDVDLRVRLGFMEPRAAEREHLARRKLREAFARLAERAGHDPQQADAALALRLTLERLATSPAAIVLVNLEDLWLETDPQNVPGTMDDVHPNWRRKAAHALEEFDRLPMLIDTLRAMATLRTTPAALSAPSPGTAAFEASTGVAT